MDRATKLARVTRLRDRALDLLKTKGAWHTGGHGERLLGLDLGDLSMLYRTPFQVLPRQEQHLHDMRALIGGKAKRRSMAIGSARSSGTITIFIRRLRTWWRASGSGCHG
jgi:hypothetical protein